MKNPKILLKYCLLFRVGAIFNSQRAFQETQKLVKSYFWLDLFTEAKSCQTFIYYFTIKTPAGTNLISYLSVMLLLAMPHRKSSRATFLVILSGYISRTEKDFATKFCTLAYHKKTVPKNTNLGLYVLGPQNYRLPNTEAAAVLAMLNLPFFIVTWRCSKVMLKIVEASLLSPRIEKKKFWQLKPLADNLC